MNQETALMEPPRHSSDIELTSPDEQQPLVNIDSDQDSAEVTKIGWRGTRRTITVLVGICLIVGIGLVGFYHEDHTIQVQGSNGFISLVAAPTRILADEDHLPLCAPSIVKTICERINSETLSYHNDAYDKDLSVVHAKELEEVFMLEHKTIIGALLKVGVTNLMENETVGEHKTMASEFPMKCQDLCAKMVASFDIGMIPKYSNVGCVDKTGPFGAVTTVCDVDVGPKVLDSIKFEERDETSGIEDEIVPGGVQEDQSKFGDIQSDALDYAVEDALQGQKPSPAVAKFMDEINYKETDYTHVRQAIVNFFRVFPPVSAKKDLKYGGKVRRLAQNNGVTRRLAEWYENMAPGGYKTTAQTGWEKSQAKLEVLASSYLSRTLNHITSREISTIVEKWYGSNDETTRTEIKRLINNVADSFGNVEYRVEGAACRGPQYAYVMPNNPKYYDRTGTRLDVNSKGQYIVFLCNKYVNSADGVKLETIIHEFSHMKRASTEDEMNHQKKTLYGQPKTLAAAKQCKSGDISMCQAVLGNAETFCFFVCDAQNPKEEWGKSAGGGAGGSMR